MANDFSSDANCVALWKLDNGASTTDSKGTNTLTNVNVVTNDAVNQQEGDACGDFELDSSQCLTITDANLDAGFPLKNGDATKIISLCAWCYLESLETVDMAGSISRFWNQFQYDSNAKYALSLLLLPWSVGGGAGIRLSSILSGSHDYDGCQQQGFHGPCGDLTSRASLGITLGCSQRGRLQGTLLEGNCIGTRTDF